MDNPIEKKAITQDKNHKSKQNKKERKGKKRDEDRVKDLYEQVKKHKAEQDDKENALNEGDEKEEEVTEENKSIKKKIKVPPSKRDESQEKFKLAEAVAYLEQFKSYRDQWKFRKIVQVYIFQNLYTENKLLKFDEDMFENILLYIKDSKGKARQSLLEEAKEIFESDNTDDAKEEVKEEVKEEGKEEQKEEEKTKESENKSEENIKKTGYSEFQKDRAYKIMSILAE
ncbi:hypothetical protein K502DRAFT_330711 [Neoconidiobolus thromboides FSU 785]|nr:hypothetical protein K502DRAFT_330711 [Neoconidiobolus thromboides FSU 785]